MKAFWIITLISISFIVGLIVGAVFLERMEPISTSSTIIQSEEPISDFKDQEINIDDKKEEQPQKESRISGKYDLTWGITGCGNHILIQDDGRLVFLEFEEDRIFDIGSKQSFKGILRTISYNNGFEKENKTCQVLEVKS